MNTTLFRSITLAAAVLALLATLTSLSAPARAKTLVYCVAEAPEDFRPAGSTVPASFDANHQIYDRLVGMEAAGARVIPGLAESWELSQDGTVYTIRLRHGVKWHVTPDFRPTRDLTADDVIFTLERLTKPAHPFYKAPVLDALDGAELSHFVQAAEKVDDLTVRITLTAPNGAFFATLASDFLAIQSKEYADQLLKAGTPEKLDLAPVGTGPFVLAEHRKGEALHFVAFPQYWAGAPQIDDLVFTVEPNDSARWQKVERGECHVMTSPAAADLEAIGENDKVEMVSWAGLNTQYLAFNTQKKPFDDVRVRRGLGLAINKKAVVEAVYGPRAMIAVNAVPPTMWSYNKGLTDDPYYPAPAKKLFAEAGYAGGFTAELWIAPSWRPGAAAAQKIAEMVRDDLAQVGVKVEIKPLDAAEFRKRTENGEHQIALFDVESENGDPDSILRAPVVCDRDTPAPGNTARWCDADYQKLVANARANSYYGERGLLYQQAQGIVKKKVPWFPIAHVLHTDVVSKQVAGFKPSLLTSHRFSNVDLRP